MEKRISYDEFMSAKRVAQACNPLIVKRDKVSAKIAELQKEFDSYDTQISALDAGIRSIIGLPVDKLVKKVIEPQLDDNGQPVLSKEGKPVKVTKYLPTEIVSYDKDHKQYVVTLPDEEIPNIEETSVNMETNDAPETDIAKK